MSNPISDTSLVQLVNDQERIRRVASAYSGFSQQPGLVVALARAGASDDDIRAIGGFTKGLQLSTKVELARQSGVQLDLTDEDRAALAAMGTRVDDVDRRLQQPQPQRPTHRGFFGSLAHYVNDATQLAPVKAVFGGMNRAADVATGLYRAGEQSPLTIQGLANHVFGDPGADRAETRRDMTASGYNPGSLLSTFAFYSRGSQVYHNLDDLRSKYDPQQVDLAQRYLVDPANFIRGDLPQSEVDRRQGLMEDPKFQDLVAQVDSRHASPGREIANALHLDPNTGIKVGPNLPASILMNLDRNHHYPGTVNAYQAVSGSLDAAFTYYADPTIVLGKAYKAAKVLKYGLSDLNDTGRIESLMRGNANVRRGWSSLLDDAKAMRSGDPDEAAAAYARVRARTPDLLPMLDEINGGGLRNGDPIGTYEDLVGHVTGQGALIRMSNGLAAREAPLMPGALSGYGYRQVRGALAASRARKGIQTIDLTKDAGRVAAVATDGVDAAGKDVTGLANGAAAVGEAALAYRRTMKGRLATVARRIELLPENQSIDLIGGRGAEDVRRFAALYMPTSHANALAARFSVAPLGERKGIAQAVYDQVVHAAGIPGTASGRAWLEEQKLRRATLEDSAYDHSGLNNDRITGVDGEPTRRAGLYEGHASDKFVLPDFRELRQVAAKVGVYDHVMGSWLDSGLVDKTMTAVRTMWLNTPSSALRNSLEDVISAGFNGIAPDELIRSRGALSGVTAQIAADHFAHVASKEVDPAFRTVSAGGWRGLYVGKILTGMKRAQASMGGQFAGGERAVQRAREVVDDVASGDLNELFAINNVTTRGGGQAVDSAMDILDRGYNAAPVNWRGAGYQLGTADGAGGARYWSQQFGIRWKAGDGPRALRAVLENVDLDTRELDRNAARRWLGEQGFAAGKNGVMRLTPVRVMKYWKANPPKSRRDELIDYLLSDEYKTTRAKLERFQTLKDGTKVGDDPPMIRRAAEELADDQIKDMGALVTDRNGQVNQAVAGHLVNHGVPSAGFLQKVAADERPDSVIRPFYVPDLGGADAGNVVQSLLDRTYHVVVGKPMNWMTRMPIYHANYSRAYDRVESLYRQNFPDMEISDLEPQIRDAARHHAMDATVQMIDNPRVRSQYSLITRNVFSFWRAQEDFIRRWGRNLKENPAALRQTQLAVEGGMHTGLVYRDDQGQLIFAYPGSGYAIKALSKSLGAFGALRDQVGLATVPNMTTKLQFLNSGLDRPFVPTVSPVAAVPLRVLKHFTHDQVSLIEGQRILEGDVASNRSWYSQFLPSPVYRLLAATSNDEREGQYASAARNAALNLYAAGLAPKPHLDPVTGQMVGPSPDEQQAFKQQIRTGVRNHLVTRALLALILPGAPSSPTEETDASRPGKLEKAAYANAVTLQGEFRGLVAKLGYPRALETWTKTHPNDLAYTVGTTEGGGQISPTQEVLNWLQDNKDLAKNYPSLTAYFTPSGPGDFSQDAWRTELELGLRRHKDLDTFYRDIAVRHAEDTYFNSRDEKDRRVADAIASGDDDKAKQLKAGFRAWLDEYKQVNPLLLDKWQASDENKTRMAHLISEVDALSQSSLADRYDPNGDLVRLAQAYRAKQQFLAAHRGTTDVEVAGKDAVQTDYQQYVAGVLARSPYLIPLYRGIFDQVG